MDRKDRERTLAELAAETGTPPRTIRYYIARGLLAGPNVAGRKAAYGGEHAERLAQIRKLQAGGLTLAEIARALAGERKRETLPAPAAWWNYALAGDVVVSVRGDASPWRLRLIREGLEELAARLRKDEENG